MQQTIVQLGHSALRTECAPVPVEEITTANIQTIIKNLVDTLEAEADGVGLSAPQIAATQQIFIVSPKAFEVDGKTGPESHLVCINPIITKTSKKTEWMEEGCLSIRWVYGEVERYRQVTLEYYDEHGKKQSRGFSGFVSHVVQHELDHLHGVLFIDKAKDVRELTPKEIQELQSHHQRHHAE